MKKILAFMVMIGFLAITTHATDNLTIPNTFNSGETISSSKINENFQTITQGFNKNQTNKLGANGQNIIDIGNTRIITGTIRMNSGSVKLNYDDPFIEVYSANATWKESTGFAYVLWASSDTNSLTIGITENSSPSKDVNYIVIGKK